MSQVTADGHLSSFAYGASIFGLSIASCVGVFKVFEHRKRVRHNDARPLDEVTSMRQVVEGKEAEISTLRRNLSIARADIKTRDETLTILRQEMECTKKQLVELEMLLERSRDQNQALVKESKMFKDEAQAIQVQHAQTVELLEARSLELKGAEPFLTKADRFSGTDVIAMVEGLNAEVLQTAASMADLFEYEEMEEVVDEDSEEVQGACAQATEVLGARFVAILKSQAYRGDPTLMQYAFQACMSAYSDWMISSWYFENPENEHWLNDIYDQMRQTEEQGVAGRWRALTRTHAQRLVKGEPDIAVYFVDAFVNVLITAGFKGTKTKFHDMIMESFSDRMAIVGKWAVRLNKAIGEGITSSEVDPIYIAPDVVFDPALMEDGFDKGEKKDSEHVLCTTDLGLLRAVRGQGDTAEWQEKILVKPRVVLASVLEDMEPRLHVTLTR